MNATIRQNKWGNWYGYIGRRKAAAFFDTAVQTQEQQAKDWLTAQTLGIRVPVFDEEKHKQRLADLWAGKPMEL